MRASLTNENVDQACEEIERFLTKRGVERKERLRIKLGAEEALMTYQKAFGAETEFRLDEGGAFGRAKLRLTIPGASLDPYETAGLRSEEDSLMQSAMIRMGKLPRWRFRHGANEVLFASEKSGAPEWLQLIVAITAAVILGLLVRQLPESARLVIQEGIIAPLMNTFLGFLNAVAGPMIFLSAVWGIYSIGDAATFSEIGKRLCLRYGAFLCGMTLPVALIGLPLFELRLGAARADSGFSALYQMVLDIVPTNLFTPFSRGNTLQILFVAVIIGIAMLRVGKDTQSVAELSEQLGYIVNGIMGVISRLVPAFVFGSTLNIVASSEIDAMEAGGKFFFGTLAGCAALLILHTAAACLQLRISPITLWQKTLSTFLIAVTTASSSAAFADNLTTCVEKLGVSRRVANFGVPFGQILYKPAVSTLFWYAAVSTAESVGLETSVSWLVTALVMCIVLSAAAPPVPLRSCSCSSASRRRIWPSSYLSPPYWISSSPR